ncbi:ArsR family transcriptional regulator [Halopiger aswanensis]|uniref:ArsR family transcriptional regulator n=1 Tax=Halopiger aswanensis TaxID=148449 RepID=UPI000E770456|nr:ArsR family transcriptional regulator [Halopiger aswanensis]
MSVDSNVPWDLVSRVRRSDRKSEIIELLEEEPASATDLSEELDIQRDTISNYFRDLKTTEPPLIECLTPDQPHHRIYGLTETGDIVSDHL